MSQNLPVRQERRPIETAVQRRDREAREARAGFLTAIVEQRESFERSLRAYDIDYDAFQAAIEVGLERIAATTPEFFLEVRVANFVREVARAAHVGLRPDGKQGAIVKFKNDCTFIPMVDGFVEVIWKTGLVKDVNHQVVCEGDDFDFEEGDEGYVRHRRSLKRASDAEVIGAWCVINLVTGGRLIEVVDQVQLKKIAKVNKAQSVREAWEHEMHRKAPLRRIVKRMPKAERLNLLIALDDRNVKLENAAADEAAERPSSASLFSNKPIRQRRARPEPVQEEVREVAAEESPAEDGPPNVPREEVIDDRASTPTGCDEAPEGGEDAADQPFALRAVISRKNGLQEFDNAELWYGDLRQKMRSLEGEPLAAFWGVNRPHIEEAGRNGHGPAAMKLIELAEELGLLKGGKHGDQDQG